MKSSTKLCDNRLEEFGRRRMQCPHTCPGDVGVVRCLAFFQSGNFWKPVDYRPQVSAKLPQTPAVTVIDNASVI